MTLLKPCKRGHERTTENTYFYKGRRTCRECKNATARKWSKNNSKYEQAKQRKRRRTKGSQVREYANNWRRDNPDRVRAHYLKQAHGISVETFDAMNHKQKGRCAVCLELSGSALFVDHDHTTGNIRGLLCSTCNSGIGMLKDDTHLLKSAIKYLEEHSIMESRHDN